MNRDERTVFSLGAFVVAVFAIFVAFWAVFLVRDDDGSGAEAAGGARHDRRRPVRLQDRPAQPGHPRERGDTPAHQQRVLGAQPGHSRVERAISGHPTGRIGHGGGRRLDGRRHVRDALHDRRSRRCGHEGHGAHRRRDHRHRRHDGWFDDRGSRQRAIDGPRDHGPHHGRGGAEVPRRDRGPRRRGAGAHDPRRRHEAVRSDRRDRRLGGRARQDRAGLDVQRRRSGAGDPGRRR